MTEETSTKHKLLQRPKWGKLFASEHASPTRSSAQDLTADVVDFLKPSTDASARARSYTLSPRADSGGTGHKWPDASTVRNLGVSSPPPVGSIYKSGSRRTRKEGLSVRFVQTEPEVIGNGGDETETPTLEVSQRRTRLLRSQSERKPDPSFVAAAAMHTGQHVKPGIMGRAQTHKEAKYYVQHPGEAAFIPPRAPPGRDPGFVPPILKRAPTGFTNDDDDDEDDFRPRSASEGYPSDLATDQKSVAVPIRGRRSPPPVPRSGDDSSAYNSPEETRTGTVPDIEPTSPTLRLDNRMHRDEAQVLHRGFQSHLESPENNVSPPSCRMANSAAQYSNPAYSQSEQGPPVAPHQSFPSPNPEAIRRSREPSPLEKLTAQSAARETFAPIPQSAHQRQRSVEEMEAHNITLPHSVPRRRVSSVTAPPPEFERDRQTSSGSVVIHNIAPRDSLSAHPSRPSVDASSHLSPYNSRDGARDPSPGRTNVQRQSGDRSRDPSPNYFSPEAAGRGLHPASPGLRPSPAVTPSGLEVVPPSTGSDDGGFAAFADFATRVGHMRSVFQLTAEKQRPSANITTHDWLSCALWWFHKGRIGLESQHKSRARSPSSPTQELLTQPHVDIAKAWWVLTDVLGLADEVRFAGLVSDANAGHAMARNMIEMRTHLQALTLWMQKCRLLPPYQSLIQGQDTTVWISYPRFTPDVAYALNSRQSQSATTDGEQQADPFEAMPLSDSRNAFFYNRMFVTVSMNTDNQATDRVGLPCLLSVTRRRADYQTTVIIASQNELVNIVIRPMSSRNPSKGVTWRDISRKARSNGIFIALSPQATVSVDLEEQDLRTLWNLEGYTRKVEESLAAQENERLVFQCPIAEAQYVDTTHPHTFPKERVRGCFVCLFDRTDVKYDGHGSMREHRGYRLVLITPPGSRTLSSVSHDYGEASTFICEQPESAAGVEGATLTVYPREGQWECRMVLAFRRMADRGNLLDCFEGFQLISNEMLVLRAPLQGALIEPAEVSSSPMNPINLISQNLRFDKVTVVNIAINSQAKQPASTVSSENLRIVLRHTAGALNDRINLGPGEMLLRLPRSANPTIQILRAAQKDMTVTVDRRKAQAELTNGVIHLKRTLCTKPTIRSLIFRSLGDLHQFQRAITGYEVRFDAVASVFAITRRRMVVSVHRKLEATNVRVQIVSQGSQVQLLAFFEDFAHADSLILQLKGTDEYEMVKADKGTFPIKLVEAKFSLPKKDRNEVEEAMRAGPDAIPPSVKRRFVNLDVLEYAEEHDDIVIGFGSEEDRERFSQSLPAAVSGGRQFSLKRRI